jgi:hypothetical protein
VHKPGRFLQDLLYQPLMSGARTSRLEFARQESQWRSDKTRAAQQPEAIEGCQERSLLVQIRPNCACAWIDALAAE